VSDRKYSIESVGSKVDEFLDHILDLAGLDVDYEMFDGAPAPDDFETPELLVKFKGSDEDLLLANRAEVLLALEHLTMESLRMPSEDHSKISFDANDYRLLRIEELRLSATAAAEKVKRTGQPFRFNPMNSRERRVIHLALRNDGEVRSESLGSGMFRQVVVYPAGMASLPEPPPPPPGERGPRRPAGPGGPGKERGHGASRGPRSSRAHGARR
jgi:spoIIIJ-associated protein